MNQRLQKCWAAIVLVLCLVAACLAPLGTAYFARAEEGCEHKNREFIEIVQPTCFEEGYTLYYCPDCGETYKANIEEAYGHNYQWYTAEMNDKGEVVVRYWQCMRCGDQFVEYLDEENDTPTFDDGLPAANADSLPGWAIALIVIIAVLFAGGIGAGIFFYMRSQKKNS